MFKILKKFNKLFDKKQKKKVILLFFIMLGGAVFEVAGVSLMLPMVTAIMNPDIIYTNKFAVVVCKIFNLHSHRTFVIICIAALIVIYAIKNIYLIAENYVQARFVYNHRFYTQKRLLHAYLSRPYEFFLSSKSGEILRTVNNDVVDSFNLLMTILFFFTETIVSTALTVTVFFIDPIMTSCIVAIMAIASAVILKIIKPMLSKKGKELRKHRALANNWLLQSIQGIKEIKVAQKEEFFETNFEESGKKQTSAEKWESVFKETPKMLIELSSVCATLAVIALMIYRGKPLDSLIPSLAAFAMAAIKLLPSANRIVSAANSIAFHGPCIDKLLNNLDGIKDFKENRVNNDEKLSFSKEIQLKDISFTYPNSESKVLDHANMTIPVGKSIGIVGKSGAGKTTTVDIMLGLLEPQEGQILADGKDVKENYSAWLNCIGYIPQSIFMLDGNIRDNVAFGSNPDDEKVWNALEEAQLADFVRSLPDQLNTEIGEAGIRLSGGQRQRIGIARALYNNPQLLVFDEATSSLDNDTEAAIMESIESLHGKKTIVIIAHRLQTIEKCDLVYTVEDAGIFSK